IDYPETVNINDVTCQLDDVNLNITENQIRISWVNQTFMSASINPSEPIVVIAGQINKKYNGNDIKFEINSKSHFCDQDGNKINTRFALPLLTTSADYLSASYPNPASESAMISFSLPCDSKTILNVYNQNGQLVNALINKDMAAGQYTINLPVQELTAGVYFYTLNTSGITNISQSKRLIVIH
ncbi:MAG: T9SS type A sorting domain-containing protein, partial [Lentimicrobiaceae bacterium]